MHGLRVREPQREWCSFAPEMRRGDRASVVCRRAVARRALAMGRIFGRRFRRDVRALHSTHENARPAHGGFAVPNGRCRSRSGCRSCAEASGRAGSSASDVHLLFPLFVDAQFHHLHGVLHAVLEHVHADVAGGRCFEFMQHALFRGWLVVAFGIHHFGPDLFVL